MECSDGLQRGEIGRSLRFQPGETEDGMKAVLLGVNSGLNQALAALRGGLLRSAWGMDIGSGCRIALSATLDKTNPRGVHWNKTGCVWLTVGFVAGPYKIGARGISGRSG